MKLILQLQSVQIEPESESKFHRRERIARNVFIAAVTLVFTILLVIVSIDIYYYEVDRTDLTRQTESILECVFFFIASITLIVLWRKFTQLCGPYISDDELKQLTRNMNLFIGAYSVSSIIDVFVEAFNMDNGVERFSIAITVTLLLDLCTIGVTLYLNFRKTQHVKKTKKAKEKFLEDQRAHATLLDGAETIRDSETENMSVPKSSITGT